MLSVKSSNAVSCAETAIWPFVGGPKFWAVGEALGGSVVACAENMLVADDERAD